MDRRRTSTESSKNLFERSRNSLVATSLAIGVAALSACGPNAEAQPPKETATQSSEATPTPSETAPAPVEGVEAKFAEAEAQYEAFVASFTPEQKVAYDKLSPENLATMSDVEMQAAFAIPLSEVADENGEIDPNLYAVSNVLRSGAADFGPCTDAVISKYGSAIDINPADIEAEVTRYTNNAAQAMIGTTGTVNTGVFGRCVNVTMIRDLGEDTKNSIKPYEFVASLVPDSTQFDATTGNISFTATATDNWDSKSMSDYTGESVSEQLQEVQVITQLGLHANEQGNVVPTLK